MRLILSVLLLMGAGVLAPAPISASTISPPPSAMMLQAALGGRKEAAGSVAWMLTIQHTGRQVVVDQDFPYLEDWLERVVTLNPHLELPYHLGTVLLITDRKRSGRMDSLLAVGEEKLPEMWEIPMLRGIGAYFGQLDAKKAAVHFAKVDTFPNAPRYFGELGRRIASDTADCGSVLRDYQQIGRTNAYATEAARAAGTVFEHCVQRELEQAATSFKLNETRAANSVQELLDGKYIDRLPPHPPGRCWAISGVDAELRPCPNQ